MSLQENTTTISDDDTSALYRVWRTPGYPRFIYAVYVVLGIIFYGIGIYTAFSILMRSLNDGTVLTSGTALFLCYVLLNGIIGYGFIFYRKWLMVAFSSTLVLTGLPAMFFFVGGAPSRVAALPTGIFMTAGILLFLFLTKHFLSGRYLAPKAIIPFVVLLLFSLLLTNFSVLH